MIQQGNCGSVGHTLEYKSNQTTTSDHIITEEPYLLHTQSNFTNPSTQQNKHYSTKMVAIKSIFPTLAIAFLASSAMAEPVLEERQNFLSTLVDGATSVFGDVTCESA